MAIRTNPDSLGELLKPAEAAEVLRVHPRTLTRMADRGEITVVLLPSGHRRYREDEIARLAKPQPREQVA